MENTVETEVIRSLLTLYDFEPAFTGQKSFIHGFEADGRFKLIFRVTLTDGRMLVLKLLHEEEDTAAEMDKIERQSMFSETMRAHGISTPTRYRANGRYCNAFTYRDQPCIVTIEDWCGEELRYITPDIAHQIGALMARMHTLSLEHPCRIGHGTLFSAAYENDVDAFPRFCALTRDERLDQAVSARIRALHDEKLAKLRAVWETLPKAAVQGDISINNLVLTADGLTVFDYNNAGDEVLISDLVMEGLLTACEMDLPEGVPSSEREALFPAFLAGYLSVRPLSDAESAAAWEAYTLYHALWFTRIVYNDDSLSACVSRGEFDAANRLLAQMLADMEESDDGRFRRST